jgi:hypothetical protein
MTAPLAQGAPPGELYESLVAGFTRVRDLQTEAQVAFQD